MSKTTLTNSAVRDAGRFHLDINLDDEHEAKAFTLAHGAHSGSGRRIATKLGIRGKGSAKLATSLHAYAWNKVTAISCRKSGNIQAALTYEQICDTIYSRDIQPVCECW